MSGSEQTVGDVFQLVQLDIHRHFEEVCSFFDRQFDAAAKPLHDAFQPLRHSLEGADWLPDFLRPEPAPIKASWPTTMQSSGVWAWTERHRALGAALGAFAVTGAGGVAYFVWKRRRKQYLKKRRARKGAGGVRKDVVIVAGIPSQPLVKSILLDLERRGFIVYVVVANTRDEEVVKQEGKDHILPLHLNVTDPSDVKFTIDEFSRFLRNPKTTTAVATAEPLTLTGVVLVPDVFYPSGPVELLQSELWSDSLNAKLLNSIATSQAFIPLLRSSSSRLLVVNHTIAASLRPSFQGIESTVTSALEAYTTTLTSELGTLGIPVCHLRLGIIDYSHVTGGRQMLQVSTPAEVLGWPSEMRRLYADNFTQQQAEDGSGLAVLRKKEHGSKGSPLREVNNAVFDALTRTRPAAVWRIGRGSRSYELVGHWAPTSIVNWMMGIKSVSDKPARVSEEIPSGMEESHSWEKIGGMV